MRKSNNKNSNATVNGAIKGGIDMEDFLKNIEIELCDETETEEILNNINGMVFHEVNEETKEEIHMKEYKEQIIAEDNGEVQEVLNAIAADTDSIVGKVLKKHGYVEEEITMTAKTKKDYTLNGTINATTWQEFRTAMKDAGISTGTKTYEQLATEYEYRNRKFCVMWEERHDE